MPSGLKSLILRPEQVARIRAKYPDRVEKPIVQKRIPSKEYLALRRAAKSPKPVLHGLGCGVPDGGWTVLTLRQDEDVTQKAQWLRMAWLQKFKNLKIWIYVISTGEHLTVERYIRSHRDFVDEMIGYWNEILKKIPKGFINE